MVENKSRKEESSSANSLSIFETVFHIPPLQVDSRLRTILDKTFSSKKEFFQLINSSGYKITKRWTPKAPYEVQKVAEKFNLRRLTISRKENKRFLPVMDLGILNGGQDDLAEVILKLSEVSQGGQRIGGNQFEKHF